MAKPSIYILLPAVAVMLSTLAFSSPSYALSRCQDPVNGRSTYITGNGPGAVKGVHIDDPYEYGSGYDCTEYWLQVRGVIYFDGVKEGDTGYVSQYGSNYLRVYSIPHDSGVCNGIAIHARGYHNFQWRPDTAIVYYTMDAYC